MIDVLIIDKENTIAPAIDAGEASVLVYDDEIRALHAAEAMRPDIVVLNYTVREQDTAAFIALLTRASKRSKIVLIAENLTDEAVIECLMAGAKGYLQLSEVDKFINKLLQAVQAGEAWITRRMVAMLLDKLRSHAVCSG
ncbi:response regulator transcription factor [Methylobacter sp. BBA5.1]|jgi:DNA-binding NarL/FixJ family response regulator|uniref:response regulator transcription factor n=1 Tax=Methylobacter sp. BBA5.1 TaxID=1495064 RepID=UPI00056CF183|nr:response regulator transcription factor [Methylobacter sp. BBA5.1]